MSPRKAKSPEKETGSVVKPPRKSVARSKAAAPNKNAGNGGNEIKAAPRSSNGNGRSHEHESLELLISRRAYELFLARGAAPGNDFEDWLEAEQQIRSAKL